MEHAFFVLGQGLLPIASVQLLGAIKLIRHLLAPGIQQAPGQAGQGQSCGQRA